MYHPMKIVLLLLLLLSCCVLSSLAFLTPSSSTGRTILTVNTGRHVTTATTNELLRLHTTSRNNLDDNNDDRNNNQTAMPTSSPSPSPSPSSSSSSSSSFQSRRSILSKSFMTSVIATTTTAATTIFTSGNNIIKPAYAEITEDSYWPLWTALPVAPFNRRRTIRYEVAPDVYVFDQMIGIYYVHVPIRMSVFPIHQKQKQKQNNNEQESLTNKNKNNNNNKNNKKRGLVVFAPVAPTRECLSLMQELIDIYGPVRDIILPSVAVEHKVNAGPFAKQYPNANFYVTDKQYSFPFNLPNVFLGLPSWTKPLPRSSSSSSSTTNTSSSNSNNSSSGGDDHDDDNGFDNNNINNMWGGELEHEVITVKPGIGSMYQDVALLHKPSETLMICDTIFAVNGDPPKILTEEEEYVRALLWHARESKDDDEYIPDTPENRRKGWRRIVLLFNFFFPGSGNADLSLSPIIDALKTPTYKNGWGGWKPFTWISNDDEMKDFETFSNGGKPTILPIIQIILSRNTDEVQRWLDVVTKWKFSRVIPMHLDTPITIGPRELQDSFLFLQRSDSNIVRFCDEDVKFLRSAEEGPLSFSVYKTSLGPLKGKPCGFTQKE